MTTMAVMAHVSFIMKVVEMNERGRDVKWSQGIKRRRNER